MVAFASGARASAAPGAARPRHVAASTAPAARRMTVCLEWIRPFVVPSNNSLWTPIPRGIDPRGSASPREGARYLCVLEPGPVVLDRLLEPDVLAGPLGQIPLVLQHLAVELRQIAYALGHGWAILIEHTDDPHPRNTYWDLWGLPLFDLGPDQADVAMREIRACREACSDQYVKVGAYDRSLGRQTTALSFIVNRPADEPGFRLERQETADRQVRYSVSPYAAGAPRGRRYGAATRTGGVVS